ncbi:MAG: lysophospholipid acyltransferase family protein [Deltaproteobacteria bacterium]|nr:lysophospholipid acyltransferase family protein [Deltaproteobacteria bacterium]
MQTTADEKLIDIKKFITRPVSNRLYTLISQPVEKLFALGEINGVYRQARYRQPETFFNTCLSALGVHVSFSPEEAAAIPRQGPLIVVANHPFGGIDGVILGALLTGIRSDVKILGNYFLQHIPELRELIIPVDPFGGSGSARKNVRSMKEALRWLQSGGSLMTFPSGEVSHLCLGRWGIADKPWSEHVAWLARRSGAAAVPVYFQGRNSAMFQLAGMVHPRLRTMLLPREVINKKSRTIRMHIGSPISFRSLAEFQTDKAMIDYLRLSTYLMKNRAGRTRLFTGSTLMLPAIRWRARPLASATAPHVLQQDIDLLPEEQLLCRQGEFSVYIARACQIPRVLQEIGRLREQAFREIGEGTGRLLDTDRFDQHYLHIFMWNGKEREIAGGYRLGPTDGILPRHGAGGLYVTTLFKFKKEFLENLGPALEMGRSFIAPHYQKKHNSLSILWRGIGEYVARNPQYKMLFGPVSISNDYHRISKNLMLQFLLSSKTDRSLSRNVKPRNPVVNVLPTGIDPRLVAGIPTLEHVNALVAQIEHDRKGIPVLLRHYLKLNGVILSFNIDKNFSSSIDSLLVVDLLKSEKRLLKRFMGPEGLEHFMAYHGGPAGQTLQTAAGF